jgi:hypothetical protein
MRHVAAPPSVHAPGPTFVLLRAVYDSASTAAAVPDPESQASGKARRSTPRASRFISISPRGARNERLIKPRV